MRQVKLKLWIGQDFWFCGDLALVRNGKSETTVDADKILPSMLQIVERSIKLGHIAAFDTDDNRLESVFEEIAQIDGSQNISLEDNEEKFVGIDGELEEDEFQLDSITINDEDEISDFVDEPVVNPLLGEAKKALAYKASLMKEFVKTLDLKKKDSMIELMIEEEKKGKNRKTVLGFLKKELKS